LLLVGLSGAAGGGGGGARAGRRAAGAGAAWRLRDGDLSFSEVLALWHGSAAAMRGACPARGSQRCAAAARSPTLDGYDARDSSVGNEGETRGSPSKAAVTSKEVGRAHHRHDESR